MARHILILVVFFSFLGVVLAQEKTITVQVIIADEQEEHPGSVYLSTSHSDFQTVTNSEGTAKINVRLGDFVFLTSESYYNKSFIVTNEIIQKERAEVILKPKVIELEQANLGFKLTGNLAKDAKNAGYKDSISIVFDNLGVQEVDVPPPNPNGRPAGENMVIENLIGSISGYARRQKSKFAYDEKQKKLDQIRDYFGDEYLENELKIPKHKIQEFIFFVGETTEILSKVEGNYSLEAEEIIIEKSKEYLQRLSK